MKATWLGGPKCGLVVTIDDKASVLEVRLQPDITPLYEDSLAKSMEPSIWVVPVDKKRRLLLWYEGRLR